MKLCYMPACLSIGMLCCVSRLRLRNQLRALLWLDVSLSFVLKWDTHNKLSMNSHNTVIVLSQLHQLPRPQAWAGEAVDLRGQEPPKSIVENGGRRRRYSQVHASVDVLGLWPSVQFVPLSDRHNAQILNAELLINNTNAWLMVK